MAWHAFHTIARSELEKRQLAIGDHVGVAYHGPTETAAPGMSPAERWRLIVDQRAEPVELGHVGGERPSFSDEAS
jgi:hypothetical protein